MSWWVVVAWSGLSPRVRGNPDGPHIRVEQDGSIPACAGEPAGQANKNSLPRVYPRVCGGTIAVESDDHLADGLSPRVRGNPRWRTPSCP